MGLRPIEHGAVRQLLRMRERIRAQGGGDRTGAHRHDGLPKKAELLAQSLCIRLERSLGYAVETVKGQGGESTHLAGDDDHATVSGEQGMKGAHRLHRAEGVDLHHAPKGVGIRLYERDHAVNPRREEHRVKRYVTRRKIGRHARKCRGIGNVRAQRNKPLARRDRGDIDRVYLPSARQEKVCGRRTDSAGGTGQQNRHTDASSKRDTGIG